MKRHGNTYDIFEFGNTSKALYCCIYNTENKILRDDIIVKTLLSSEINTTLAILILRLEAFALLH